MKRLWLLGLGLLLLTGCAGWGGPADTGGEDAAAAFRFDESAISGAKPWTPKDFLNDPYEFQFAIIGDRTGGANVEGTFKLAMGQLNLLQPEFVINVGDLIEGYTDDPEELSAMWKEADGMTGSLRMPFFHTRGNHDVSFEGGREAWEERLGPGYYWFVYKDVLFMALDSEESRADPPPGINEKMAAYKKAQVEDPEAAKRMLAEFMADESVVAALSQALEFSQTQLEWIEETLAAHPDVRWTFLFMHEPAWENPSESFKEIQGLLANRKFTFFAGHLHYYDYDEIDGHEYITMGPAGASWHHDGPGNVDHIMWVTMREDGPEMGNIALKGVFDRNGLDPSLFGAYDRKGTEE